MLGTAPYMSPEQARGQEADRRGDIWAFGCVPYEMLAGKRAFEGATFSDTVAAVLDREPDWSALPRETPPLAQRLLRRCLQKEKDKRLHDVADARLELEDILAGPDPTTKVFPERRRRAAWPVIAILAALLGGFASWVLKRPPSTRNRAVRFNIEASASVSPLWRQSPLLSPAGDRIAYDSLAGLVVRELDQSEGRVIPGTAFVHWAFFPGRQVARFRDPNDFSLKKVSLTGGASLLVCKGVTDNLALGATWGPDDMIVFTPDRFRVSGRSRPPGRAA
jgi:serine/threonine-protein kinase